MVVVIVFAPVCCDRVCGCVCDGGCVFVIVCLCVCGCAFVIVCMVVVL